MAWNRKDAIVWTLNFAFNRDMGGLREASRRKIYDEIISHLFHNSQYEPAFIRVLESPGGLENIQVALREFFLDSLFPAIGAIKMKTVEELEWLATWRDKYLESSRVARNNLPRRLHVTVLRGNVSSLPAAPKYDRYIRIEDEQIVVRAAPEGRIEDEIIEKVIALIEMSPPLGAAAFLWCKGCQHFFHGKKMRRFCTPACNRRYNSRKRRGEPGSPERIAYNIRQAKIMRMLYRKAALG